jgi:phosphohistidine phosphatase
MVMNVADDGRKRLYLLRHGEALPAEEDPERGLSAEGERAVQRVTAWARVAGIQVDEALHSGKRRAEQTAVAFTSGLVAPITPRAAEGLKPNDDVRGIVELIEQQTATHLLVGHLPHLSRLVSQLVLGDTELPLVTFEPATLVRLVCDEYGWTVDAVVNPNLLGVDNP